ncbi:MAG: nucleotidyltransferase family protein [Lachnospiraceae bacterium]|nr:nucleotidyltransferase family protein [Lachnospiraceae bacterium]
MKTGIILLAAGAGKRFGGNKLMAEIEGKALYHTALEKLEKIQTGGAKVVVTGNTTIAEKAIKCGMEVVMNDAPELGISRSIRLGIEKLEHQDGDVDSVMFMVCDQPWLRLATLEKMVYSYDGGILMLACQGQQGNPVIFENKYFKELKNLSGDLGGRQVITRHRDALAFFETKIPEELWDIDTRDDLKKEDKRLRDGQD